MLISKYRMLSQTRRGVGSIAFHKRGPMMDQRMSPLCQNPEINTFLFSLYFGSSSFFLEMIMLISSVGMLL